jgi:Zn-dependent M28 family amino/carboxypeptidase
VEKECPVRRWSALGSCVWILALLFACPAAADLVDDVVTEVSQASYTDYLDNHLYTHLGDNRLYGSEHDLARDEIYRVFDEDLGLSVSLDPFTYSSSTYHNVVATHPGVVTPGQVYVVGAHYDSTNGRDAGTDPNETPGAPGADDNASGVAGVLEAARVLSQFNFQSTVVFIAFDREEQGLHGSNHYAGAHAGDDIRGMISLDMIAYNPAGTHQDKAWVYYAYDTSPLMQQLADALDTYGGITAEFDSIPYSDHAPFDAAGFDAALLIEHAMSKGAYANPNYHKWSDSVDTPDYIDYAYATGMTRGTVGYLAEYAGAIPDGDASLDDLVDLSDLGVMSAHWGSTGAVWTEGEFTRDGVVDLSDLGVLSSNGG